MLQICIEREDDKSQITIPIREGRSIAQLKRLIAGSGFVDLDPCHFSLWAKDNNGRVRKTYSPEHYLVPKRDAYFLLRFNPPEVDDSPSLSLTVSTDRWLSLSDPQELCKVLPALPVPPGNNGVALVDANVVLHKLHHLPVFAQMALYCCRTAFKEVVRKTKGVAIGLDSVRVSDSGLTFSRADELFQEMMFPLIAGDTDHDYTIPRDLDLFKKDKERFDGIRNDHVILLQSVLVLYAASMQFPAAIGPLVFATSDTAMHRRLTAKWEKFCAACSSIVPEAFMSRVQVLLVTQPPDPANRTLFVGFGDKSPCSRSRLQAAFAQYGKVVEARVVPNEPYAFVEFGSHADAAGCIEKTAGSLVIDDAVVAVRWSRNKRAAAESPRNPMDSRAAQASASSASSSSASRSTRSASSFSASTSTSSASFSASTSTSSASSSSASRSTTAWASAAGSTDRRAGGVVAAASSSSSLQASPGQLAKAATGAKAHSAPKPDVLSPKTPVMGPKPAVNTPLTEVSPSLLLSRSRGGSEPERPAPPVDDDDDGFTPVPKRQGRRRTSTL